MTRSENGNYHWTGTFDREYEMKQYQIVATVVEVICIGLMIFGGFLCIPSGDWGAFLVIFLSCIAGLLITIGVIRFFKRGYGSTRGYGMSEYSIWTGSKRYRTAFVFDSAKHVIFTDTYIEPVQKIRGFRIYVPADDMPFVRDFVMKRLPSACIIDDRAKKEYE